MADWKAHVVGAQRGDLEAFDRVVRQFQDMAVGYAYSILQDFSLAEDAAQEAFIQAFYDLAALRESQAFPAWFRRLVFKQCDRLTRRKRVPTVSLEASPELADPGRNPLDVVQQREVRDAVLNAVNELPENERAATALFYIDGYSMAEVGEFLEVPVSTVKSRLHAARRRMQERMVGLVEETMKQHAPGDDFGRKVRKVLEGVPRISLTAGRNPGPHSFAFPGAMEACMQFLGEDPIYDYVFHLGTSGAAFGLTWYMRRWWYCGDLSDMAVSCSWPEPIRRAFEAVGYEFELVVKEDGRDNEAYFRERIVASIKKGLPVLASGVVGPPCCTIITGFDEGGDVLMGWSHFQQPEPGRQTINPANEFESEGYFRKRGWFPDTFNLILLGNKRPAPPLAVTHRRALEWAVQVTRMTQALDRIAGLRAYTAWADDLLRDGDFPTDEQVLLGRLDAHAGILAVAAEGRMYAPQFLGRVGEQQPDMAAELELAAACYKAEFDLLMQVFEVQGGFSNHDPAIARKLGDPAVRRQIVPLILQARDKDEEAVGHIERALAL